MLQSLFHVRTPAQALRRQRTLAILDSLHGLLISGRHATPRELYYTHATLFQRQQQSDDVIKKLCQELQVARHHLHLFGTAKGLVRGHVRIFEPAFGGAGNSQGCWVDGMDPLEPRGHSITPMCAHVVKAESMARTVLIVEKETVFHRLIAEGLLERHKPLVIVTARGFPDIPTRYFLRRVQEDCAAPRMLVLSDFDPAGLWIAATYAFGPARDWNHDDITLSNAVPLLFRKGVAGAADFGLMPSDEQPLSTKDGSLLHGLRRRLAQLRREDSDEGAEFPPNVWQEIVDVMSEGGVKFELDALEHLADFVSAALSEGTAAA